MRELFLSDSLYGAPDWLFVFAHTRLKQDHGMVLNNNPLSVDNF